MAQEINVRPPGAWGVAVNWEKSVNDPRVPRFNVAELPPDVVVPDFKGYAMVHVLFTVSNVDHAARRVHFDALLYPRITTIEGLKKLNQRFPPFVALLQDLVNKASALPENGAQAMLVRYRRKRFPPTETPEETIAVYDWCAPLRQRQSEAQREFEIALQAATIAATTPTVKVVRPDWWGMEDWKYVGPLITRLFSTTRTIPASGRVEVPAMEEIDMPEADPWEAVRFQLDEGRLDRVDVSLDSLYSMLVVQQEGAESALRAAGLVGHVLHKTRVADGNEPLSRQLWGQGSRTIVIPDSGTSAPPRKQSAPPSTMAPHPLPPSAPPAGRKVLHITERKK